MRLRFAVSICALCLCSSPGLPQEVFSVPIADKSGEGAPFEVRGNLTLRESARANELEWSWGEKVAVKNISDKAILFFVATITEIGRYSAAAGRQTAIGDGPTYQLEDDRFFSGKLVEPGEWLVLRDTNPGTPDVACCVNPLAETHQPFAEYRLRFVQFADGSVYGDPSEARGSLAIRQTILLGVHELLHSYEMGGETGFVAEVRSLQSYLIDPRLAPKAEREPPFFTTAVCREIIARYDSDGAGAALGKTREILKTAESHAAMIARHPHP